MLVAHYKLYQMAAVRLHDDETGAADSPMVSAPRTAHQQDLDFVQKVLSHSHSVQAVDAVLELLCFDVLAVIHVSLCTSASASCSATHMHRLQVVFNFCLRGSFHFRCRRKAVVLGNAGQY